LYKHPGVKKLTLNDSAFCCHRLQLLSLFLLVLPRLDDTQHTNKDEGQPDCCVAKLVENGDNVLETILHTKSMVNLLTNTQGQTLRDINRVRLMLVVPWTMWQVHHRTM